MRFLAQTLGYPDFSLYFCRYGTEQGFNPRRDIWWAVADKCSGWPTGVAKQHSCSSRHPPFICRCQHHHQCHTMSFGHKNPEYTINGQLGDRKGIMGEKGVTAGFKAAKKQGCKIVVIDLDEHILQVRSFELSKIYLSQKSGFCQRNDCRLLCRVRWWSGSC